MQQLSFAFDASFTEFSRVRVSPWKARGAMGGRPVGGVRRALLNLLSKGELVGDFEQLAQRTGCDKVRVRQTLANMGREGLLGTLRTTACTNPQAQRARAVYVRAPAKPVDVLRFADGVWR
jgi:hypothetical protein